MTPALESVLKQYERGYLPEITLVVELVLCATAAPTPEWVQRLPASAVEWVCKLAANPADHPWTVEELESLNRTPPVDDEMLLTMWRNGLSLWRAYFGTTAE